MKKKQIISLILALCLLAGTASAFAAGAAGSSGDPLISKSYIDGTFSTEVLKEPLELIKSSMSVLEYKLSQKTAGTSAFTISAGGGINALSGGSFILLSGSATLARLTGTLIDVTDGTVLSAGQALTARHRYVAGANTTAGISVTASAKISAMGSVTTQISAMAFTDVGANSWFYNYVLYAFTNGLINGKSATSFAPEENLKVNEAIKLAACIHQLNTTGSVSLQNGSPTWYSTYLEYATSNGIVTKTYSDYDAYIARNEFVDIFYRSLPSSSFTAKNTIADNSIPDVKTTDNYAAAIYAFYRAGILNGVDGNGSFSPTANIKRSEVSAIITRMLEKDQRI